MATPASPSPSAAPAPATDAPPAKSEALESPRADADSGGGSTGASSPGTAENERETSENETENETENAVDAEPAAANEAVQAQGNGAAETAKTVARPPPLELVPHDLDDDESDSDEDEELRALNAAHNGGNEDDGDDGDAIVDDSELGTPLGFSGGAGFGSGDEFATHRFYGPSVPGDDASARALHSLRRVHIHDKPPRFCSEPAGSELAPPSTRSTRSTAESSESAGVSRRTSSNGSAHSSHRPVHSFSVSFDEPVLGFQTNVVVSLENELVVEVSSVDADGAAHRAGVAAGDWLASVNGQPLEPSMTREQVLDILQHATAPRVLVFERETLDDHTGTSISTAKRSKSAADGKPAARPLMGRLSSAVSYGSSIVASKWKRKKPLVHADSFCDGCGLDPIVGALWTCAACANFNLCGDCYETGTHGLEDSDQMQMLSEALVQFKLQKKCKQFTPEFLLSLRRDVCKGRPDKFEYMGGWIAEIVNGTAPSKITVRGIEVPCLPPAARQRFVTKLMGLVSNRRDIEVNIEWLPDESEAAKAEAEAEEGGEGLEKLRIWISDKKTRTSSPFA